MFLSAYRDITERKKAEEELKTAKDAAEAATRAKSDFLAMIGRYIRFQDKQEANTAQEEVFEPFIDRVDNQQVAADNVLVLKFVHQYAYKAGNSEVIDILLGGSGEAYAFRDGQAYKLQWNRPGSDLFTLTFPDGTPYSLKPGTTWIQVVGRNSTTEQTQDNGMRFEFRIP